VLVVVALLACAGFLVLGAGNAALLALAEHPPARGPLRDVALGRLARTEAEDLDTEHRDLLSR
jgi:hypothetical protein